MKITNFLLLFLLITASVYVTTLAAPTDEIETAEEVPLEFITENIPYGSNLPKILVEPETDFGTEYFSQEIEDAETETAENESFLDLNDNTGTQDINSAEDTSLSLNESPLETYFESVQHTGSNTPKQVDGNIIVDIATELAVQKDLNMNEPSSQVEQEMTPFNIQKPVTCPRVTSTCSRHKTQLPSAKTEENSSTPVNQAPDSNLEHEAPNGSSQVENPLAQPSPCPTATTRKQVETSQQPEMIEEPQDNLLNPSTAILETFQNEVSSVSINSATSSLTPQVSKSEPEVELKEETVDVSNIPESSYPWRSIFKKFEVEPRHVQTEQAFEEIESILNDESDKEDTDDEDSDNRENSFNQNQWPLNPTLKPMKDFVNEYPIIGILAQEQSFALEQRYPGQYKSFIAASYVKFLEGGGARVVPIWINKKKSYYRNIMKKINGVLFPGGATWFNQSNGYADAGWHIYQIAKEFNAQGDYFPIWGACLGFELLTYLDANRFEHRDDCQSQNQALNLDFKRDFLQSRMFRDAPRQVTLDLAFRPVTSNFHRFCVSEQSLIDAGIAQNWHVLSTNRDWDGFRFISSIEHVTYPFYGVQFHPEKNLYEWVKGKNITHTKAAVRSSQYFAQFFVDEARKSMHTFTDKSEEYRHLIYNFPTTFTSLRGVSYEECYMFRSNVNYPSVSARPSTTNDVLDDIEN